MSKRARTVHLDATKSSDSVRMARCGWLAVDTATDMTEVTCKVCLRLFRAGSERPAARRSTLAGLVGAGELVRDMAAELRPLLAPVAGPPPRLTAALWASSCRGAEHRRCGTCELCAWEREADKWHHYRPWVRQHRVRKPAGAPAWPSLAAALVALVDWERHDRVAPSAMGPLLEHLARGGVPGDGGANRPDDPLQRRAGEMVAVRVALELAFPEGAHRALSRAQCIGVLLARTAGVLATVPTYVVLAAELSVYAGDLKALVRSGRERVTVELAARGLIPMPAPVLGLAEAVEDARRRYERAS